MANHYIFLIDSKKPYDEQMSKEFTTSINIFSKASFNDSRNNNNNNNKISHMLSIVSIKSNGKSSIIMNEQITKTNTTSLKIMKRPKVNNILLFHQTTVV